MKKISSLHKKWIEDEAYRKEYDALETEFASASLVATQRPHGKQKKATT